MKTFATRSMYALGVVAALALLAPGDAAGQAANGIGYSSTGPTAGSGGPGTLGTEVPNDSAVAQGYYHSRSNVEGDSRQLGDSIRQLITENRRAMQQAQAAAQSGDAAMADAAKQVADARSIAEFNLLRSAQESGFELGDAVEGGFAATGSMGADSSDLPSYGTTETATAAAETSQSTGSSEESSGASESLGSTAQSDAQTHASTLGDLVDQAREENRLQLASSLEVAQKALDSAANASSALSSSTGTSPSP
ncbi:MAG TPA: hypothetical protein VEB43_21845 [Anaeromyxobacter sp.]|nr:hypothetical protein [Anaeromyxobacter sp.]